MTSLRQSVSLSLSAHLVLVLLCATAVRLAHPKAPTSRDVTWSDEIDDDMVGDGGYVIETSKRQHTVPIAQREPLRIVSRESQAANAIDDRAASDRPSPIASRLFRPRTASHSPRSDSPAAH